MIQNPWGASCVYFESCDSTMTEARRLAEGGSPCGTVALSDFQRQGRGRGERRDWQAAAGKNLLFTLYLSFEDFTRIPKLLTLRAGLAVSRAIEGCAPALAGRIRVKWPNDVMIRDEGHRCGKKTAGILTESDGRRVFIGCGVNVQRQDFYALPRATSIGNALSGQMPQRLSRQPPLSRDKLLEKILRELHAVLAEDNILPRLNERLYLKGDVVCFVVGAAASTSSSVTGRLEGLGPQGELLITPAGETAARAFWTGELCSAFP
jgi:BirA family biotin operon repressor/biotin-[acetyl-CoA-carboxylase] ligase